MKIIFPVVLFLIFPASLFAQTNRNPDSSKIAVIDTSIFDDNEKGIKLLVNAKRSYHIEYFEIHALKKRIENVKSEIKLLIERNEPINEKFIELRRLENELDESEKAKVKEFDRKWNLVITPLENKIKEKLKEFASKNGYAVLIDKKSTGFLIENDIKDVTFEFIKFCNDSFEKEIK